ncbi:FadR/GntR family transcriptional regulator [Castellaniella sp.]|uniref:FadR/GntR family transcriptional regulator n=1 Tax=Castellaniella sp. TaxID=1955812 RepID=UPI002AFE9137|nr:FadR/GntR family transcriptional regulator [Castellaniella sp.]
MELGYGQINTRSAASQIADQLQQAIIDGRLKVDERLPTEEELAAQFGVSRPTVREALKRLAARHLIRSRRGPTGGTFVSGPSPEELATSLSTSVTLLAATGGSNLDDMAMARLELEAICCRHAAENRTQEHLDELRAELALQRDPSISDQDFCASDVRFHRIIVHAAGNAFLRFLMNAILEVLMPVSNMIIFRVRDRKEIVAYHARMITALDARDPDMAVATLAELIDYIRTQYEKAEEQNGARRS